MDEVLEAWDNGVNGLLPMSSFVGNRHPTIKLNRAERKALNDHGRIVRKIRGSGTGGDEGVGRDRFWELYEMDADGGVRKLRAIREILEREASERKK